MKFIHQCLFSPTVDTLCKAINNKQLIGFPHLTSARVRKYLPESTAMAKGHMNRQRKGVRSTTRKAKEKSSEEISKAKTEMNEKEADMSPPQEEEAEVKILIGATIGDQIDQTGAMPIPSFHGKQYQFVAYEYRSNAILVRALKDLSDQSMIKAFTDVYEYLTSNGLKPKLNVMDNACSRAVQKYIKSTKPTSN